MPLISCKISRYFLKEGFNSRNLSVLHFPVIAPYFPLQRVSQRRINYGLRFGNADFLTNQTQDNALNFRESKNVLLLNFFKMCESSSSTFPYVSYTSMTSYLILLGYQFGLRCQFITTKPVNMIESKFTIPVSTDKFRRLALDSTQVPANLTNHLSSHSSVNPPKQRCGHSADPSWANRQITYRRHEIS